MFLQERQDTVIDSDTIVLILVSVAAFIGQLIAVLVGNQYQPKIMITRLAVKRDKP